MLDWENNAPKNHNPNKMNKDCAPGITPSMPAKYFKPTNQIEAKSEYELS